MKKIIIIALLAIIGILIGWRAYASLEGHQLYETVEVEENDTLWDIVSRRTDSHTDVRKRIYEVKQLNHIDNSGELIPGQKILIPVK